MKILIVEDAPERICMFSSMFREHDYVIANSAKHAIDLVKNNKFDVVFLDHDLGGRAFVDSSDPNTGMQVVKAVYDSPNMDSRFIIHSMNPGGVDNMYSYLKSMGCEKIEKKVFGSFDGNVVYN